MSSRFFISGLVMASTLSGTGVRADLPPLIPRQVLFGNPDRLSPQISPDGTMLAYIAPDAGVLNVWVRTIGQEDDRVITKDRARGIREYFWARNGKQIIYLQDKGGDENWHVHLVGLADRTERDLTPFEKVQAQIVAMEKEHPDEILISLNRRDPKLHDVYRADLRTGKLTLVLENTEGFMDWTADHQLRVRSATKTNPDGGSSIMIRDTLESPWRVLATWGSEDSMGTGTDSFAGDNRSLYILSSAGSDTTELREIDPAGNEKVLAGDPQYDATRILRHPIRHTIQAVGFDKDRREWKVLDPGIEKDFVALAKVREGDFSVLNRDDADRLWLVSFDTDDGPVYYYAYDRKTGKAQLMFSGRKALEGLKLAKMRPIHFQSRDGLTIHGYLTTPPGIDAKDLPMVLNVHGGPWYRDRWGYDGEAQWLANRGFAVLQVNFRGSTGYGKKFVNAANRQWGGKMHDDLVDAVNWAIKEGVADPKRVAIYGGSYGGYATLVGMTFTPDLFCCGAELCGPSNLITFMNTIPPYWKPFEPLLWARVGNPEKDADFLKSRSPFFAVDRVKNPLLIAQGVNDPRVKVSESRQMVEALKKAGREVEYVEYPDEGHGFARPENRLDFYAKAEKFLARHLGGRCEP
jgi:dipeptidyl aminopeptidase/acylaminoacyl peptidase